MIDYKVVAEDSNMIINGYAFLKEDKNIRVLHLITPMSKEHIAEFERK
ncbi:MAG: hypothetical protein K2J67_03320 [Lachnospiraceae bacterium]|nr:hypothetical protein [Lachnospiraceae bacterium]